MKEFLVKHVARIECIHVSRSVIQACEQLPVSRKIGENMRIFHQSEM